MGQHDVNGSILLYLPTYVDGTVEEHKTDTHAMGSVGRLAGPNFIFFSAAGKVNN